MRNGRRDNVQRVGVGSGFGDGPENARVVFGGDFMGRVGVGVKNSGEFNLSGSSEFGVNAGMFLAKRADTEDGHSDYVVDCHDPSLPLKTLYAKNAKDTAAQASSLLFPHRRVFSNDSRLSMCRRDACATLFGL